jgi:hypothetical protein
MDEGASVVAQLATAVATSIALMDYDVTQVPNAKETILYTWLVLNHIAGTEGLIATLVGAAWPSIPHDLALPPFEDAPLESISFFSCLCGSARVAPQLVSDFLDQEVEHRAQRGYLNLVDSLNLANVSVLRYAHVFGNRALDYMLRRNAYTEPEQDYLEVVRASRH